MRNIVKRFREITSNPEVGVLQVMAMVFLLIMAVVAIPLAREVVTMDTGTTKWVEDNTPDVVASMYNVGIVFVLIGVIALSFLWMIATSAFIPQEEDSGRIPMRLRVLRMSASVASMVLLYLWAVWCEAMEYADIWIIALATAVLLAAYAIPGIRNRVKSRIRKNRVKAMNRKIAYYRQRSAETTERLTRLEEHIRTHPA